MIFDRRATLRQHRVLAEPAARLAEGNVHVEARLVDRTPLRAKEVPQRARIAHAKLAERARRQGVRGVCVMVIEEAFFENLQVVLPAVRVDMFIGRARAARSPAVHAVPDQPTNTTDGTIFVLESKKHGLRAQATLQNGEFIVEAGSTARLNWESKAVIAHSYSSLYAELKRSGVLRVESEHCVFTQSYAFQSPSAAAAVVTGRPAAGTVEWKVQPGGLTYKQWEASHLDIGQQRDSA